MKMVLVSINFLDILPTCDRSLLTFLTSLNLDQSLCVTHDLFTNCKNGRMLGKGVLLSENLRLDSKLPKWILCFFSKQIKPISLGQRCIKGMEKSLPRVDYSVPLMDHDASEL